MGKTLIALIVLTIYWHCFNLFVCPHTVMLTKVCIFHIPFFSTPPPPSLPGNTCCSTLKILGVTVTNTLSMAKHSQNVIKSSSQSLHLLRILHLHGMSATIIQHIFQAVVIANLTYASQSWSGFTSATDIQHLKAFLCRSIRQGFCPRT